MAIIGVGTHSIEAGGYNVFDSHARDLYHNSHSEGTGVLLEIPSLHKLVQYFRTLHATFEPHLFFQAILNIVVYQVLIVIYQCFWKQ